METIEQINKEADFLLTRTEASRLLRVSLPQLDRYRRVGDLPVVWLDSHPRYLREDLETFAKNRRKVQ